MEQSTADITCRLCQKNASEPQWCQSCDNIFCYQCIQDHLKNENTCPECLEKIQLIRPKKYLEKYHSHKIACFYQVNGCRAELLAEEMKSHEVECKYKHGPIEVQCQICGKSVQDDQLNDHYQFSCKEIKIKCEICENQIPKHLFEDHQANKKECKDKGKQFKTLKMQKELNLTIIGNMCTGKTSLMQRYVKGNFSLVQSTIDYELTFKSISINSQVQKVTFWDTCGMEKYHAVPNSYYQNKDGIVILYDISDIQSFYDIEMWMNIVRVNTQDDIPIFLIGSKSDLHYKRKVSYCEGLRQAEQYGFVYFDEVSSKDGSNVVYALDRIIKLSYFNKLKKLQNELLNKDSKGSINLSSQVMVRKKRSCKC